MEAVVKVHGVNGKSMTIGGPDAGLEGVYLATEVEGLFDPEIETVTKSPSSRPGTRLVSHRILERTLVFRVTVLNDEDDTWRSRDTEWRKLWAYDKYTTIEVQAPGATARKLEARLTEIRVDTEFDPHTNGATDVEMTVVADDPFWYEPAYVYNGIAEDGVRKTISVGNANPTSNPVFPVWVLEAPGDWTIRDGDTDVPLPTLRDGEHVVIDTDPAARQLVSASDTPVWQRMNGVRFRSYVEPYSENTRFHIEGSGSFQLRLKRPFNRPWGDV